MIKFIYLNFKFPVCYFFTTGNEAATALAPVVIRVVTQLINLRIRGMVCDAPAKHRNFFRLLGATVEEPSVFINGKKIDVFLDPPHGMKVLRNCLMTHVFLRGDRAIKTEHVNTFYWWDLKFPARLAPKLTDVHLQPKTSRQKMDCELAYQLLSGRFAAGLYAYVGFGQLPADAEETANFISHVDSWVTHSTAPSSQIRSIHL